MSTRTLAASFLLILAATAASAENNASGKVSSRKTELQVAGAYGYWAETDGEKTLTVAVSNVGFVIKEFDRWYDKASVIHDLFVDEDTKVIAFQFTDEGRLKGYSYYWESGDGCGFCADSKIKSSVKVSDGHLKGKITYNERNASVKFDITFDVPMPPKVWGTPLPSGGAELSKVYEAYRKALGAGDVRGLKATTDAEYDERLTKHEKDKDIKDYIEYRWDKIHLRQTTVRAVGAYQRGDEAVLLVDGSSRLFDNLHGDVIFRRENGKWLVSDELFQIGRR